MVGPLLSTVVAAAPWLGVHVLINNQSDLDACAKSLPALARAGTNAIVVEVDYSFRFKRRPEMAQADGVTLEGARRFSAACRKLGVRVIPQINCLGHQSWAKSTGALLRAHPELDESPGKYPENKGIYCRSWCPSHPDVPKIVFPLVDELIDAFQAKSFHCGMDEVFLIGDPDCARCRGKSTAELFAKSVNDFYRHLHGKGVQMLIWSDRLIDGNALKMGEWEAAVNGTHGAIDLIPKDVVLCDWHYEKREDYRSIDLFVGKGFSVWPTTFKDANAATAFATYAKANTKGKVIGALSSNWGEAKRDDLAAWPALVPTFAPWRK